MGAALTVSTSRAAYEDCFALLDRAMDSPAGIRHSCFNEGAARYLLNRLNYARIIHRNEMSHTLPDDDPKLGTSPYDILINRVREADGKWWVYIEARKLNGETEELPPHTVENIHDLLPTDGYRENGVRRRRMP